MSKYKDLFRSRVSSAIGQARSASGVSHSGLKGEIAEILIRELFKPLLPSDVGVATGQILEFHNDKLSPQQDVIIYDKSILPPILYEGTKGIIPVESVLYTIEIKTTLNAAELRKAHEAAKELYSFCYLPGKRDQYGNELNHPVEKARSVIFALNSDLSVGGKSEVERYREIYGMEYPYLRAICVTGKEYWWEKRGSWIRLVGTEEYDETLAFIGGISNTYKWVGKTRGWPNLGNYIIKSQDDLITFPSGTEPTVNLQCENCGSKAVLFFNKPIPPVDDYPSGFVSDSSCPKCRNKLVAPPGRYENKDGLLVKVSDIES